MSDLFVSLKRLSEETDFSGVVAVSKDGKRVAELTRGYADRAQKRPNQIATQFGTASATKGLTALAVCSLVQSGELSFDTRLTSLLGDKLPLVDPLVTIEQLLGHTSGVGDYLDEEQVGDIDDFVLDVPVQQLASPLDYLPLLVGHAQKAPPGSRFAYNNSGFVLLSLAIEVAGQKSFYDLVRERVLEPAGMLDTAFLRSDELPERAAIGYLKDGRSNRFHLPVRGAGDGGVYSTVADVERLWSAMFSGRIVSADLVELMIEPLNVVPAEKLSYGLGFWRHPKASMVILQGLDAGVSFWAAHNLDTAINYTVISNSSTGVWPLVRFLDEQVKT